MIYFLLVVIIVELGVDVYLRFKVIPPEIQKEVLRKVAPVKSEVMEWEAPESIEEKTFNDTLENIHK